MSVQIGYTEPLLRPLIFGDLCLLERISIGGMAEVYRAKPLDAPDFDRLLAVKRILPNLAEDDEFVQMFVDEAKIAIRLNHPNIAQIYELGRRGSSHYIVMEYVAGHDLLRLQQDFRQSGTAMGFAQAAYIVRCMAAALSHAHEHKSDAGELEPVVHRDVSPANILISFGGEAKLIDFGIAKVANRSSGTQVGVLKGKFSYMSPEQVAGKPIDPRADQFSLGVVFHELLTGRRLFATGNDFETLERVRDARVEPPSHLNDTVPYQLDNLVMRLLAREPGKRFALTSGVVAALDEFLDGLDQPYGRESLSNFMVETFAFDLARERRRRERYAAFVSAKDVIDHNERLLAELSRSAERPQPTEPEPVGEQTQIVDSELEVEGGELERGKDQQVLAESKLGRLKSLLEHRSDAILASLDLPDAREHDAPDELFRPHPHRSRMGAILAVLGLLLLGGLTLVWTLGTRPEGPVRTLAPGMVMLEAEPETGLQVFLDGRLVGTDTPMVLRDVAAGEHVLEVRHPDYQTYRESLRISGGRALQQRVVLAERPSGMAVLDLRLDPPDTQVWLNGARLDGRPGERRLQVSARETQVLEMRRPGYYTAERRLQLPAGAHELVAVALEPAAGRLVLQSEPAATVLLDDEVRGDTRQTLVLDGLDRNVPHRLRLEPVAPGHRPWETIVLFDGHSEIELFPTLPRFGSDHRESTTAYGYLAVDTGERWFRLLLDGRDTGLTTPVPRDAPLALRAGVREVRLVRGEEQHVLTVEVAPDTTVLVDCRAPEQACGI